MASERTSLFASQNQRGEHFLAVVLWFLSLFLNPATYSTIFGSYWQDWKGEWWYHNKILKCTTGIGSLKVLKVLAAHGNQLQWLPDALTQLSSLQDLWIQASIPSPLDPATPPSIFWMMWSFFEISPLLEPMLWVLWVIYRLKFTGWTAGQ